jgi:PAS domain S-box-containing protein
MAPLSHAWLCQHLVDTTQDAVIFADREGIMRLWNAGAEILFGYTAAEALGQSLDLLIPPPLRVQRWEGYRRVMATGLTPYARQLLAVPGLRKDGTRISLEFTVVLIEETLGKVRGIAAVLRDVTVRWQRDQAMQARLAMSARANQEAQLQRAEAVRQAYITTALQAYEEAGISGLCHEGR